MRLIAPRVWPELCLASAVVMGAWYAVIVPFGEKPDEPSHMARIVYEARFGRTPDPGSAPIFPNVVVYEAVQPPAYYWLAVQLLRRLPPLSWTVTPADYYGCVERSRHFVVSGLRDPPEQALTLRLLGLVWVAVSGVLVFGAAGLLGAPPGQAVLASALTVLTPQVLFVSTGVTNDAMALAAGSLVLWIAIRAGSTGSPLEAVAAGILAVMAVGVKLNTAPYLAAAPLLLIGGGPRRTARSLALFLLGVLAVAVPGILTLQAHGGGLRAVLLRMNAPVAQVARPDYLAFIQGMFTSYWARFGWMDIAPPGVVGILWIILLVLATTGWAIRSQGHGQRWTILWPVLGIAIAGWMLTLRSSNQIQGRFLFPFAGVVGLLLARGIGLLSARVLTPLALAGVLAGNALSLASLRERYQSPVWPADLAIDTHQCRDDRTVEESLSEGTVLGQTFVGTQPGLAAIDVVFTGMAGRAGTVCMELTDAATGYVYRTVPLACAQIRPLRHTRFRFEPVMESGNRLLCMSIRADGADPRGSLSLRFAAGDRYLEGTRLVAGLPREGDLTFVAWVERTREVKE